MADLLCTEQWTPQRAAADPTIFNDPRVLHNLLSLEPLYAPKDYFGSIQSDILPYMRKVVTTWMLEVCEEQHCEDQVFPLGVNILDRFLGVCRISKEELQLSGAACLLIASKLRQSHAFNLHLLCYYTEHSITQDQLKDWEMLILTKLNWDISSVTSHDFVDHIIERCSWTRCQPLLKAHSHTLVSLACTDTEMLLVPASVVASAAVVAAARGLKAGEALEAVCNLTNCVTGAVEAAVAKIEAMVDLESGQVVPGRSPPQGAPQPKFHDPALDKPETPKDVQDIHF